MRHTRSRLALTIATLALFGTLVGCAAAAPNAQESGSSGPAVAEESNDLVFSEEVIAYAGGDWTCTLETGGSRLPFAFDFRIDPAGEFAFDIGGSGAWFTYQFDTDGGAIASTGATGQSGVAAGSRLTGLPTELPAEGESVTLEYAVDGGAPLTVVVVRDADGFQVSNPGIADADLMHCRKG